MSAFSRCAECRSPLISDMESGEMVCCRCGIVAKDHIPDSGVTLLGSYDDKDRKTPRASGRLTFAQHDFGITTGIAPSKTDFSGNAIKRVTQSKMSQLRKWQHRIRLEGSRERRVAVILSKVSDICGTLSLPQTVLETASLIYRNLDSTVDLKNKSIPAIASAVVYMACKKCDAIRSMQELIETVCPPREVRTKTKLANRYYRVLVLETGSPRTTLMPLDKYISKISNISDSGGRAERLALRLARKTKNQEISSGRDPHGLAAAYLCIATMLLIPENVQRDIAEAAGVTEVTVRSRCKEILSAYDIRITLAQES